MIWIGPQLENYFELLNLTIEGISEFSQHTSYLRSESPLFDPVIYA